MDHASLVDEALAVKESPAQARFHLRRGVPVKGGILFTVAIATLGVAIVGPPALAQTPDTSGNEEGASQIAPAAPGSHYENKFRCIPSSCQSLPDEKVDGPSASATSNPTGGALRATAGDERIGKPINVFISSYRTGGSKKPAPPPDTSQDDCMSCAD